MNVLASQMPGSEWTAPGADEDHFVLNRTLLILLQIFQYLLCGIVSRRARNPS